MANSGAMTNTYKLSIILAYFTAYPQYMKAMCDSRNGNRSPIPLAGVIGDNTVLKTMSTLLLVVIKLYTPYVHVQTNVPVTLMFVCNEDLSIRAIIGIPTWPWDPQL